MKKVFLCIGALFVFIGVFCGVRFFSNNPYQKRIEYTGISLAAIRYDISLFHKQHDRYPISLSEIKETSLKGVDTKMRYSNRDYKEYLSSEEGSSHEFKELNNKGGWYYNPDNGQVKVNLTGPLHTYLSHYYYQGRYQIPSEW